MNPPSHQAYLFHLVQGCHRNISLWLMAYHPIPLVAVKAGKVGASYVFFIWVCFASFWITGETAVCLQVG